MVQNLVKLPLFTIVIQISLNLWQYLELLSLLNLQRTCKGRKEKWRVTAMLWIIKLLKYVGI